MNTRDGSAATMATSCANCAAQRKLARKYKRALQELVAAVRASNEALDACMLQPESRGRGARIARVSNALEMASDHARYFGLGINFRTDIKAKRAGAR